MRKKQGDKVLVLMVEVLVLFLSHTTDSSILLLYLPYPNRGGMEPIRGQSGDERPADPYFCQCAKDFKST